MKSYRSLNTLFSIFILAAGFTTVVAQETKNDKKEEKADKIQKLIQSKNYVFVAQYALPQTGRTINLTTPYELKISGDTVFSDLPYYGRAYTTPLNPSDGGIHFTSTKYSYSIKNRKKSGWDIAILPKDNQDVRQMYLTVSENGYASLQVVSNSRQSIGYNGYIADKNEVR